MGGKTKGWSRIGGKTRVRNDNTGEKDESLDRVFLNVCWAQFHTCVCSQLR